MQKKLTIYILSYNRPDYLSTCLESIYSNDYELFEVVIINNGSTVDYSDIINKFIDLKIVELKLDKNFTDGSALNIVFERKINTKYFTIFHDDDIMHENFVSESLNYLENNDDVNWLGTNFIPFMKDEEIKFENFKKNNIAKYNSKEYIDLIITLKNNHTYGGIIYKDSAYKKNYSWYKKNTNFYGTILIDKPLLINICADKYCAINENQLIGYRKHNIQNSKDTSDLSSDQVLNYFYFLRKNLNYESIKKFHRFYSSFYLISTFLTIPNKSRGSMLKFIFKALKNGTLSVFFLFYFFRIFLKLKLSKK